MSLTAVIAAGQQGLLIQIVGSAVDVDEAVAREALDRLLPPIARRLAMRATDPQEHDVLRDVIAGGGFERYLDDPRAMMGRAAFRDGEQVLVYLYGSVEAAREDAMAVGPPAGLDRDVFARLMTLAASLLLGALSRRFDEQTRQRPAASGPADVLRDLGETVLRGLADGTTKTFRRASFARRMTMRRLGLSLRRARHGPRIDELLGDLLEEEEAPR